MPWVAPVRTRSFSCLRGESADFAGQMAYEVEGLDQAGGTEMAQFDCAGQGFCIGGKEVGEEFDALGFGNGGAGFGVVTGGSVLTAV